MQPITVAVADRSRAARVACFESLQHDDRIQVIAGAASRFDVLEAGIALRPSIIVCNLSLAADFGHWLLKVLRDQCPGTRILLLTDDVFRHDQMAEILGFGPLGFVARKFIPAQLSAAVRGIARGEAWLPRKALGMFAERALQSQLEAKAPCRARA